MIEVTCAIIIEKKRVLVTQRSEHMSHPLKWEFPGGKVKVGESPEKCIQREIREELGLTVRVERMMRSVTHRYDTYSIRLIPFVCSRINSDKVRLAEHKAFRWVPAENLSEVDWVEADIEIAKQIRL